MNNDCLRRFDFWVEFLRRSWERRSHLIDLILDAGRVRENWLQADVYLAAKTSTDTRLCHFYTNYSPKGYGDNPKGHSQPVDWSLWSSSEKEATLTRSGAVPLMIAELKFLGGDYLPKGFAGDAISPAQFLAPNAKYSLLITPTHPALANSDIGGLLNDYLRLIRYQHPANPLKLLVLMLDKRHLQTPLGRCLMEVEFEQAGTIVADAHTWHCKAWVIKGRYES
jgi:hypothetical protein